MLHLNVFGLHEICSTSDANFRSLPADMPLKFYKHYLRKLSEVQSMANFPRAPRIPGLQPCPEVIRAWIASTSAWESEEESLGEGDLLVGDDARAHPLVFAWPMSALANSRPYVCLACFWCSISFKKVRGKCLTRFSPGGGKTMLEGLLSMNTAMNGLRATGDMCVATGSAS